MGNSDNDIANISLIETQTDGASLTHTRIFS